MTCQEFEELSGALALDAITPEERKAAEEHLAGCSKCRQLQRTLSSVVDLLPLAAPQVEPSPELKERIFAIINAQPLQEMPMTYRPQTPREPVHLPDRQRRRSGWQRWGAPLVAAAILLLLLTGGVGAWNIILQQHITSLQVTNTTLQQELSNLAKETPQRYTIQGTSQRQGATGEVLYYPGQNLTVMVVRGLPALQGNKVYQGWLLRNKQPVSVGLFNIDNGLALLGFSGDVTGFDGAAVSEEPGPKGSMGMPQGQVVAVGSLNRPSTA